MATDRAGARCTVCDRPPTGRWEVSYHGEPTCIAHDQGVRCELCTRPAPAAGAGWADLGAGMLRCPRCSMTAIDDVPTLKRHLPGLHADLERLGFRLQRPVRVELVPADELRSLDAEGARPMLGLTRLSVSGGGQREPLSVAVLRGLPFLWLGRTLVHENMHAWLAQQRIACGSAVIEEGTCELAAFGWLGLHRDQTAARRLRDAVRTNPDPVYGAGFRLAHEATRRVGLATVLATLRASGSLP